MLISDFKERSFLIYLKTADESLMEYQVRLYRNKDSYNLTNTEIGDLLNEINGTNYNESTWRKYTSAYINGYDDAMNTRVSDSGIAEQIELERQELYKERVKNQDILRETRNRLRDVAREENLKTSIKEAIKNLEPIKIPRQEYSSNNKNRIGVLPLSDWHYGEAFEDFTNTYNKHVFINRISKLVADTIKYIQMYNIHKLILINLGDLISGSIHVSTRVVEECDVVEQTIAVADVLEEIILELSKYVDEIEFYTVTDNHSRTNKNKKEHIEAENFNRIIEWFLQTRFKDFERVHIKNNYIGTYEDLEIGHAKVFNKDILFVHGHNDRLGSIVPNLSLMTKIFPIAIFTGHLHTNYRSEDSEIDLIMSPSLIGANNYSKSIRKTSKPAQKLTVFEQFGEDVFIVGENTIQLKE